MLQLELGPEMERRLTLAAKDTGVTLEAYVLQCLQPQLETPPAPDAEARQRRVRASRQLATFAADRGIQIEIPAGKSLREWMDEAVGR